MKQKGFTLLEVLVAVAVGGILMAGILGTIHQVVLGTGRSNSQVVALTEINRAALQIRKDIQMAHNTDLSDGSPVPQGSLVLDWIEYTGFEGTTANRSHESSYSLSGTDLLRTYDDEVSIVGRNITYVGFTRGGRLVSVVITATGQRVPPRSETLEFRVYLRSQGM